MILRLASYSAWAKEICLDMGRLAVGDSMGNILSHTIHEVGINQCLPKETLKNDPISLFPPLESVIFDLAARFNPFLGSFWVF